MKRFLTSAVCAIIVATTIMFSGCGAGSGNVNSEIADLKQQITELQEELDNCIGSGSVTDLSGVNNEIALLKQIITTLNQTIEGLTSGGTDLSGVNSEIAGLKQQITTLNQTITSLQERLSESEVNQQDLLLELTAAQGELALLKEQISGKDNNFYQLNETLEYNVKGCLLFEIQPVAAVYNNGFVVSVNFKSNIQGANINSNIFNIHAFIYNNNSTIALDKIVENNLTFAGYNNGEYLMMFSYSANINSSYMVFLYSSTSLIGVVEINLA